MKYSLLFILFLSFNCLFGQTIKDSIDIQLEKMSEEIPALNSRVNTSVNHVSITEFLRGIAITNKINLSIEEDLDFKVVNNFSDVKVSDMLAFLCEKYDLYIIIKGNIISIKQKPRPKKSFAGRISYDKKDKLLTIDLQNDSLYSVAKKITQLSGKNIALAPAIKDDMISGYVQQLPVKEVLEKIAFGNNYRIEKTTNSFHFHPSEIKGEEKEDDKSVQSGMRRTMRRSQTSVGRKNSDVKGYAEINSLNNGKLSIIANDYPIGLLLKKVAKETNENVLVSPDIEETTNVFFPEIEFSNFLDFLLKGTDYIYKRTGQYYLVAEESDEGLLAFEQYTFQNRSVLKVTESIPEKMLSKVEAKEYPDLNSIVLFGEQDKVHTVKEFMAYVDKAVPVVLIEVMLIYVNKTKGYATGLEAGISSDPKTTGGKINPGLDLTLSSDKINNIINGFNGFGWLNLGEVTPNFYMTLKAMETTGYADIASTPRLSTLSGNEATMTIGTTEYYVEEQTNIIGTQNPQTNTTTTYKPVEANLSINILPIVTSKDDITLDIKVEQADFTEKISENAPPGKVTRMFESQICLKNKEMVLLGGLEESNKSDSYSGWPVLSKIPIIRWFFTNRTKSNAKSKLNVFIKPTIVY